MAYREATAPEIVLSQSYYLETLFPAEKDGRYQCGLRLNRTRHLLVVCSLVVV